MLRSDVIINVLNPPARIPDVGGRITGFIGLAKEPVAKRIVNARRVASLGVAGMNPIVDAIRSIRRHMMDFPRQTAVVSSRYDKFILNPAAVPDLTWMAV